MGSQARFFFTKALDREFLLFLLSLAPLPAILLESGGESGLLESNWGKIWLLLGRVLTIRKSCKNMEASSVMTVFEVLTFKSKLGAVNPKGPEMSYLKSKNQLHCVFKLLAELGIPGVVFYQLFAHCCLHNWKDISKKRGISETELGSWVPLQNCPTTLHFFIQVSACQVLRIN